MKNIFLFILNKIKMLSRAPIVIGLMIETFTQYKKLYGEFHFFDNYRKHSVRGLRSESGILYGEIVVFINEISSKIDSLFLPGEYNSNKFIYQRQFKIDNLITAGLGDDVDYYWNFEEDPPELDKYSLIVSQSMLEHLINPYKHVSDLANLLHIGGHLIIQTHLPGFKYHRYPIDSLRYYPDWFEEVANRLGLKVAGKKITRSMIVYKFQKK